jgi:hypothetical protein
MDMGVRQAQMILTSHNLITLGGAQCLLYDRVRVGN